jgi:hypothetical protein
MLRVALGFVAGYVLGAQAGRKRFEQIASLSHKVAESDPVKGAASFVADKVHDVLPSGKKDSEASSPDAAVMAAGSPEKPVIITSVSHRGPLGQLLSQVLARPEGPTLAG